MFTFRRPHQRPMTCAWVEHHGSIRNSLVILSFLQLFGIATAASIQFAIASGPCSGTGVFNECDNSDIGGTCASVSGVKKEWCCEPEVPVCGSWGETCTGARNLAGPGQILCQGKDLDQRWCCNAEYDVCVEGDNIINLCRTKFANPYANITKEEALSLKSEFFSTTSTSIPSSKPSTSINTQSDKSTQTVTLTQSSPDPGRTFDASTSSGTLPEPSKSLSSGTGTSGNGSLGTGTIAGIAVGVVAAIAILGFVFFVLFKKYHRRKMTEQESKPLQEGNQWYKSDHEARAAWPTSTVHELGGTPPVHEMDPTSRPAELAGHNRTEKPRMK